ncbi:DUF4124 domain-containing protein [Teredinibacter sp. KSP-S5-2]|uniref:DUF4124 domain-containing protein n=1 Tax=Teredinibacter sp. KSP-S5-2 TaxID=3034506 RepID=UPI0029346EF9|nr:DUF4124 domain-containing protein [Teredinibacter sp. KSP-S5-2]WNO08600.1 DUF4124 domain-containing protein [Teredinibacter sp. KSP-S5-2]
MSKGLLTLLKTLMILISGLAGFAHGEIYRWVDENGKVHFGDKRNVVTSSAQDAEQVQVRTTVSQWQPFDISVKAVNVELSEEELKGIRQGVIDVYRFFDKVMHFDFHKTVPVKVHLFGSEAEYLREVDRISGYNARNTLGVYLPDQHSIYAFLQDERHKTFATIRHEVSHAITHTLSDYAPAWLNEGLAEQMETITGSDSGLVIGRHADNHRYFSESSQKITLDQFLEMQSRDWRHQNKRNYIYQCMAGELVYFLLSSANGRAFLTRLLHEYKRGSQVLSRYLVNKHYIGSNTGLQVGWNAWLRQGGLGQITLDI